MSSAVDQYIKKAEPFAIPILEELRKRVHEHCPACVEEMKWSFPHFMYKGKILCSMASFKQHCSFGFWLASMMQSPWFKREGMGHLGKITEISQLPDEASFAALISEAMAVIDAGITPKKTQQPKQIPESGILNAALAKHPEIEQQFKAMTPGRQREYHAWINDAKTEATALKRVETALTYISEGKPQNWKYMKSW